uniref:Leucine-rich repeat-containing protein 51 n=1 Tax=Palpitomonas bilix TaxID=652834 RepID=A0A7S3CV39_9EUKA|mmetsp:Transcript_10441/g.27356  ORF Transcript_10441/g.27356 Transcript_10441/m.27356 type:complete len:197 (+) Transcript_10441:338-928(+)
MDSTAQSVKAEDSNQQVVGTLKKKGTFSETNAATEHEVTLDYAFREISAVEELLKEVPKGFEKKEDGDGKEKKAEQDDIGYPTLSTKKKKDEDETTEVVKYNSKSVRINNNSLTTVATLPFVLNSILFKPDLVGWIDLSFNQLTTIEEAVLSMKNLSVLYLHANNMKKLNEVDKLKKLPKLRYESLYIYVVMHMQL